MVVAVLGALALLVAACTAADPGDEAAPTPTTAAITPRAPGDAELPTPDVYTSVGGRLHLRVKAEPVTSTINGVPYNDILTFTTEVVDGQGTFTPGNASAYIGPQWSVQPGDHLTIDYINALPDKEFQAVGTDAPSAVAQPINLHTHGLTVNPAGNSDNVLLSIPQGRSNRFEIDIPADQYHGLYWYHPHIHGITDDQVYAGLAGHIVVGRADGDYAELDGLPVKPMMLRYNISQPGAGGDLVDASPWNTKGTATAPRGGMVYTTNGEVAPRVRINPADPARGVPAESQVWAFTNITGSASYVLAMEEVDAADATDPTVVGRPVDLTIVSIDGTPMPSPHVLSGEAAARGYLLGQGGRVAVLAQGASDPSRVVRVVQVENRSGTGDASAYDWPNQRFGGGWRDYTREVLAISAADPANPGRHVPTPAALTPNHPSVPRPLDAGPVAATRTFIYNGVAAPSPTTPNNFPIDFELFPDNRVEQPRAGTVEEWTILNHSSLHHPFHVHTQYGQVMEIVAPVDPALPATPGEYPSVQYVTDLAQPSPAPYTQDVINLPPALVGTDGMPVLGADGLPVAPGKIVLRVKFEDHLGTYVEHCHRLPHEDRGMMSLVRTIPNDPVYALATAGEAGPVVTVVRSSDDQAVAAVVPFGPAATAVASAVGDVDGDTIPDLAVASGGGMTTTVQVRSGASAYREVLATVEPFEGATSGATVALGDLNGDGLDDLVVGQGAGGRPRVAIFDARGGTRLADFDAYDAGFAGGVSVATGMVEAGGRISLLTAPGPGMAPTVSMYNFDLFGDAAGNVPDSHATLTPLRVASFDGADPTYTGGLTVATGYPYAAEGGFATVLTTTSSGPARLGAFSLGVTPQGAGHAGHGGPDEVSVSGTAKPHAYDAAAPRTALPRQVVDLAAAVPALGAGASAASLSNPTGATVLVVPVGGGPVTRWAVPDRTQGLVLQGELPHAGSAVSAF